MSPRKNILLLCPDEMKATALGCYGQTQPVSPFIDRLAGKSVRFEQCHTVHPKCSPSRAALVTGQYPHVGGHRTLDLLVRPHEINLVRELRDAGYETALFGKNHTATPETLAAMFDRHEPDRGRHTLENPSHPSPVGSYCVGQEPAPREEFRDSGNTDAAMRWLRSDRDETKPFFAWVNWNSPHPPYGVPAPFYGQIDRASVDLPPKDDPSTKAPYQRALGQAYGMDAMTAADWREMIATYLEMTRFIDAEVERICGFLEETGLSQDTLVVIWSDHGDFAGEHQLPEKWDTSFYDCITRVPLIIHDPDEAEGKTIPALVESIDVMPTLLERVGAEVPRGVQGQSLQPLIRGEVAAIRDVVFCQGGQEPEMFDRVVPPDGKPRPCHAYQLKQEALYRTPEINIRTKMIRGERWKYIYHLNGFEELYDLESDPHEIQNLANDPDHATTREKLRLRLMRKLIEAETVEPYQDYLES